MDQLNRLTDERRLFEELCMVARLCMGYDSVKKNQGTPGVDGVTIAEFETRLNEELGRLAAELASWTYQPSPVRRVEIPKPGGHGTRKLGVPTVRDRVVQATLKHLLEPIFEPTFSAHSYGFRPGRSQHQAVLAACEIVAGGKPHVVDLDLAQFCTPEARLEVAVEGGGSRRTGGGAVDVLIRLTLHFDEDQVSSPSARGARRTSRRKAVGLISLARNCRPWPGSRHPGRDDGRVGAAVRPHHSGRHDRWD
jgi:hypothetical protein